MGLKRLLIIPCSTVSRIEIWLNMRGDIVITKLKRGHPATITLKIYKPSKDPARPLKPIKLRSKGSVIIKRSPKVEGGSHRLKYVP